MKRQMLEWWGPIIDEYYAGTEDIGSTWITAAEWLAHPGSVGRPLSPAHVVGPDGEELGPGPGGRRLLRGRPALRVPQRPVGHGVDGRTPGGGGPSATSGVLDEDGYLYLTDRQAHMIISGGVNIYPQEAENVLAGHPGVADVAVIGVPDPEMGEAVKAVVELVDPSAAGPDLEAELDRGVPGAARRLQVPSHRGLRHRAAA